MAAPGEDVTAAAVGGGVKTISGTSASSAVVAGSAALLAALDADASNGTIVGRLARNADPAGSTSETGNGRVNVGRSASDTSTDAVVPAGAAASGTSGPIVGPYVAATVATITGYVRTSAGTAIAGASVSCAKTSAGCNAAVSTTTDSDGYYSLRIEHGSQSYSASMSANATGYASTAATVTTASHNFTLAANNNAPSGADKTVSLAEDASRILVAADFGFSDPDTGDALAAVKVATLPASGELKLDGATFTAGREISKADLDAGKLVYTPPANANGTGYASFTFQVKDGAGALDATPNTITFDVTAVNDAPTLEQPTAVTVGENAGEQTVSLTGITAGGNESQVLSVTASSSNAELTGPLSVAYTSPASTGTAKFTPAANASGTATITVTVKDNGGIANGGIDTTRRQVAVTVNAVNDAPVAQDDEATTAEDESVVVNVLANDSDVDNATLTVSAVKNGENGTVKLEDGKVVFTPAKDFAGAASFSYTVTDGTLTDTADVAVTVNAVNDAPVAVADSKDGTEDTALVFPAADLATTTPTSMGTG